jgi:dihydrofolate reductase
MLLPGAWSAAAPLQERDDHPLNFREIPIVLVVAVAANGVIGRAGALPWRIKSDMQRFRALTMGKPVIMGRRTFVSIPRPLKGRTTIVISRDPAFAAPGVVVAPTLEAALAAARGDALRRGADAIAVIGGQNVFARTLPMADRLEVTEVSSTPEGDTFFSPVDRNVWREVAREAHGVGAQDEAPFAFVTYERIAPLGRSEVRPASA